MESNDYAIAMALQKQYDDELPDIFEDNSKTLMPSSSNTLPKTKKNLVDPEWELIDPNPDIYVLFEEFNKTYFWNALSMVEVKWSPRMTLCAGLCCYEGHGRLCSIRLSQPLLQLRPRKDLVETLLHEMIHAYLFVTANNKDRDGHGPEFCKHMHRINASAGTNITIYHTFHDEVDEMRKHWWRCDGVCRKRPPYFGYVKRSMNRPPSKNDYWWKDHERSCGGSYEKIKEPENYGKKSKTGQKKSKGESAKLDPTQRTFSVVSANKESKGYVLGGAVHSDSSNSRGIPLHSRLLQSVNSNMPDKIASLKRINEKVSSLASIKRSVGKKSSTNLNKVCQDLRRSGSRSVNENAPAYAVYKVKTKFMSSKESKGSVTFSDDEMENDDVAIPSQRTNKKNNETFTSTANFRDRLKLTSQTQKKMEAFVESKSGVASSTFGRPNPSKKAICLHGLDEDLGNGVKRRHESSGALLPSSFCSPLKKKPNTSTCNADLKSSKTIGDSKSPSPVKSEQVDSDTDSDDFPIFSLKRQNNQKQAFTQIKDIQYSPFKKNPSASTYTTCQQSPKTNESCETLSHKSQQVKSDSECDIFALNQHCDQNQTLIQTKHNQCSPLKNYSSTSGYTTCQQTPQTNDKCESLSPKSQLVESDSDSDIFPIFSVKKRCNQKETFSEIKTASDDEDLSTDEIDNSSITPIVTCPVCTMSVPSDYINAHIDVCLSLKAIKESSY